VITRKTGESKHHIQIYL